MNRGLKPKRTRLGETRDKEKKGPFDMRNFAACRFCGETGVDLIKYGVRHYAHAVCGLRKLGAAFFDRLHPWQAKQFPILTAERFGVSDALRARAAQK